MPEVEVDHMKRHGGPSIKRVSCLGGLGALFVGGLGIYFASTMSPPLTYEVAAIVSVILTSGLVLRIWILSMISRSGCISFAVSDEGLRRSPSGRSYSWADINWWEIVPGERTPRLRFKVKGSKELRDWAIDESSVDLSALREFIAARAPGKN
jgi:hypothetical protein